VLIIVLLVEFNSAFEMYPATNFIKYRFPVKELRQTHSHPPWCDNVRKMCAALTLP
jgi:hypothetical protein